MTVGDVDSHADTGSYHLIPTESLRVPVNDRVPARWDTNTHFARPNRAASTLTMASAASARTDAFINRIVPLIWWSGGNVKPSRAGMSSYT